MEFVAELVFEVLGFLFECIFEKALSKTTPWVKRILIWIVIIAVFGGLSIGLLITGIVLKNNLLIVLGTFFLILFTIGFCIKKCQ